MALKIKQQKSQKTVNLSLLGRLFTAEMGQTAYAWILISHWPHMAGYAEQIRVIVQCLGLLHDFYKEANVSHKAPWICK